MLMNASSINKFHAINIRSAVIMLNVTFYCATLGCVLVRSRRDILSNLYYVVVLIHHELLLRTDKCAVVFKVFKAVE